MAGPTITIYRGDDFELPLQFWTDSAKTTPIDLTGCTIYFTVKKRADNDLTDAAAIFTKTVTSHTNAAQGQTKVVGVPADMKAQSPKEYTYDIQLKDSGDKIKTLTKGTFVLEAEITNRA